MPRGKYHLVTWCFSSGYDDKNDCNTMTEVKALAQDYLKRGWEYVYVFNERHNYLYRVYDKYTRGGRRPYETEVMKFCY